MAVSRRLRFEILRRDDHTCRYCGRRAPDVALTVDHVKPAALGGADTPENLVTACSDCNTGKASVPADAPTVEGVADDAERWARAVEVTAWARAGDRRWMAQQVEQFDAVWSGWGWTHDDGTRTLVHRQSDWEDTIRRFVSLGLDVEALTHFVAVAMKKPNIVSEKRWAYFCGCCWREIDHIQEEAKAMAQWCAQAVAEMPGASDGA